MFTYVLSLLVSSSQAQFLTQENINIKELPSINIFEDQIYFSDEELFFQRAESVQSIDSKRIKKKNSSHVSELFQDVPGVEVTGGSSQSFKKIVIRGMEDQRVVTTVDDAFRREQTQAQMPSELGLEPEVIKSINIQKGADSVKNGNGAIGGAVSVETISPFDILKKNEEFAGKMKYTSNTAQKGDDVLFLGAARVLEESAFLGSYSFRDTDEFISGKNQEGKRSEQSQKSDRKMGLLKYDHVFNSENRLILKYENVNATTLDSSFYESTFDDSTTYVSKSNDYNLRYFYQPKDKALEELSLQIFRNDKVNERVVTRPYRNIESTVGVTKDENELQGINVKGRRVSKIRHYGHVVSHFEASFLDEKMEEISTENSSFYGKSSGGDLSLATEQEIMLADNKVSFQLGGRYNSYHRQSDKLAISVKEKKGSYLSKSLGASFRPVEGVSLFGRVADSFRGPSLRELYQGGDGTFGCHWPRKQCSNNPNPELENETALSREVGVSFNFNSLLKREDQLLLKVTYFDEDIKDYIQHMPFMYKIVDGHKVQAGPADATHREYAARNQSLVIRQGVEASFSYTLFGLALKGSYSTMNATCVDCVDMYLAQGVTEPLFSAPADKFTLGIDYSFLDGRLQVGASGIFVSTQDQLSARYVEAGYTTEGYRTYELHGMWSSSNEFLGGYELGVNVNNVFDEGYSVHGSSSGKEEMGRNFRLSFAKIF